MEITIPVNYNPRPYQLPMLQAIDNGIKRAVVLWHRRSGKDKTLVNLIAKKMFERVGSYYYFMPTYEQGRKILWEGIDKDGFRFIDHIPKELRERIDNQQMVIELKNGSIFRVIGTDKIDAVVGTNPIGCVFSEYSLQNPLAWGYIRPILAENGGWAVFNYTSRGKNHGYDLYRYALTQDDWFVQKLTADDTGVFTKEQLEKERLQYVMEDGDDLRFLQEYYNSFEGSVQDKKHITNVPYEKLITVDTWWDLGVGDATAIWFTQSVGKEIRIIDYLEAQGEGLPYYAAELQKKGYVYGDHFAPFDIQVKELGSGISRLETAKSLGINFKVVPQLSIDDGIQAVRLMLNKCWIDELKCQRGLDCLRQYHKEYDEKRKCYKNTPAHDWSSHGSDALRYMAVGYKKYKDRQTEEAVIQDWQPSSEFEGAPQQINKKDIFIN
jgi:phage terminase large subunit